MNRDEAKTYDAVIFDFRGVLYRKTEKDRHAFFQYLETELGLNREGLRERLCGIEGKLSPQTVVEVLCASIEDPALHEKLNSAPGLRRSIPIDENIALVRPLAERYRLGLLANSDGTVEERLSLMGLRPYFRSVIDSHIVGIRKPDPAIYILSARDLGVAPERCVFIDDRVENVEGARAVGMTAILHTWEAGDDLSRQLRRAGVEMSAPVPRRMRLSAVHSH